MCLNERVNHDFHKGIIRSTVEIIRRLYKLNQRKKIGFSLKYFVVFITVYSYHSQTIITCTLSYKVSYSHII